MAGLSKYVCFCITRLQATFADSLGNNTSGSATGFWIETEKNNRLFVTDKHNLDISMKYKQKKDHELHSIEIELRKIKNKNFSSETRFFQVDLKKTKIVFGDNIDLALIVNPTFLNPLFDFDSRPLKFSEWTPDESFFSKNLGICSDVSFVGFPMNLFDSKWKLPIARHAITASVPEIDFSHSDIQSKGIVLVSGLSFAGGSGSPVFSSQRGLRVNCDRGFAETNDYCPQKLLGVMTGHLQFPQETENFIEKKEEAFVRHTGLSYFTNSLTLSNLVNANNL